ncbi:MAG: hypothetical protein ACK452_01535 [Bacteroidota bacterium]|jgi:hypothetical protein
MSKKQNKNKVQQVKKTSATNKKAPAKKNVSVKKADKKKTPPVNNKAKVIIEKKKTVAPKETLKPAEKKQETAKVNKTSDKKVEITKTEVKPQGKSKTNKEEELPQVGVNVRPLTEKPTLDKKGNVIKNLTPHAKIIKLRIDSRTIISVKSKEALRMWKEKYPNAIEEE